MARIDPEEFYDFQVNRPTIRLVEGQTRQVDWPANTLLAAACPRRERDLVLLSGIEPNVRWRTFAEAILEAAERLGVEMVITLGALIADVAHTRPVPITGLASDPELVERLGLSRSSYEGPTGIVGVVHDACRRRELTSASLWAAVPHYVAAVPNPKAALALLRRLEGLTGHRVEASELEDATERFEEQVDRAVVREPGDRGAGPTASRQRRRSEFELGQDVPSGDDDRPGVPALPAPARHGRELVTRPQVAAGSGLGGRADQAVVAPASRSRTTGGARSPGPRSRRPPRARCARPARRRRARPATGTRSSSSTYQ